MDNIINNVDDYYVITSGDVTSHIHTANGVESSYTCSYKIEQSAQLFCTVICAAQAPHHIELSFLLEKNAFLRLELLIAHVTTTVSINCIMRGESSSAVINGAYIVRDTDKVTINTKQDHWVANTTSRLMMKGVLNDYAQAVYSGMIFVARDASFTVASQENKNIVLSDNARALSIPQLEVLTNDVHCFHGSAVGRFDQEQLFYCATRGIEIKQAERLLLQGFFSDMFENSEAQLFLEKLL